MRPVLFVVTIFLSGLCIASEPAFGPEQNGLQLGLDIQSASAPEDKHRIKLVIRNVGKEDRIFTTRSTYEDEKEAFEKYIQRITTFEAYPKVLSFGFQTIRRGGESKQLSMTIKAGADWCAEWTVEGRRLEAYDVPWGMTFPVNGRFDLKALLDLDEDGKRTHLWSNTASIRIGGEDGAPRCCAGQISYYDEKTELVTLNFVGTAFGAKLGDRFKLDYGMRGYADLELTSVDAKHATAKVVKKETYGTIPGVNIRFGEWVSFVPKDKKSE